MPGTQPVRIKTIAEFHRIRNLPEPEHPLISVVDYGAMTPKHGSVIFDFYSISIKRGVNGKLFYGQQQYDFDEGVMFFMAPNQVLRVEPEQIVTT